MMVQWKSGGDDDGYHDDDGGYHDDDGDYHEAGDYDDCNSCVCCLHLDSLLLPLLSKLILDNRYSTSALFNLNRLGISENILTRQVLRSK